MDGMQKARNGIASTVNSALSYKFWLYFLFILKLE
jgi:hypothetical protein